MLLQSRNAGIMQENFGQPGDQKHQNHHPQAKLLGKHVVQVVFFADSTGQVHQYEPQDTVAFHQKEIIPGDGNDAEDSQNHQEKEGLFQIGFVHQDVQERGKKKQSEIGGKKPVFIAVGGEQIQKQLLGGEGFGTQERIQGIEGEIIKYNGKYQYQKVFQSGENRLTFVSDET